MRRRSFLKWLGAFAAVAAHYDDGDVHTGKLHCFCGEHKQGVEYGFIRNRLAMRSEAQA